MGRGSASEASTQHRAGMDALYCMALRDQLVTARLSLPCPVVGGGGPPKARPSPHTGEGQGTKGEEGQAAKRRDKTKNCVSRESNSGYIEPAA